VTLAHGLALLSRDVEAVLTAVVAMSLNGRDVASCSRLARLFLSSAASQEWAAHGAPMSRTLPLVAWVLAPGLSARYDTTLRLGSGEMADLLRQGAAARGQLPHLGPMASLGPRADLVAARRVMGECFPRVDAVLAMGLSPDQTTTAAGEAYELALMARVLGTQRGIDMIAGMAPAVRGGVSTPWDASLVAGRSDAVTRYEESQLGARGSSGGDGASDDEDEEWQDANFEMQSDGAVLLK